MASPEHPPSFLFVDGRESRRRGVQSFINSRRLRDEAGRKILAARSNAPLGWAEKSHNSAPPHANTHTLRKTASDLLAAPPAQNITTSEVAESSQNTRPAPSKSVETGQALARNKPSHFILDFVERELIRVEPFANLPIKLDPSGQALYRFSIAFLTEEQFGTSFKNPALTRSLGLWPHYNSEIRVCATLLQASAYLDRVRKVGTSNQTIRWKFNLIKCLNRIISDEASRYGDDALNGVVLLLLFEAMTPGSKQLYLHSRAMMQLLLRRGNQGCFSDHIDVALAILTSKAQIAYLDQLRPGQAGIDEVLAWKRDVDSTVETLSGLSDWVLQALPIFYRNTILNKSGFLESIQKFDKPADIFELSQQTFALCYIAVALWNIRDVQRCSRFLQVLSARHEHLGSDRPLPNTVWVCIRGTDDNPNLQFQAIQLLRVFHRLTNETQSMLGSFLRGLCSVANGSSIGVVLSEEDFTSISRDALTGLPGV